MAAKKPWLDTGAMHKRFLQACEKRNLHFKGKDGDFKRLADASGVNIGTVSRIVREGFPSKMTVEQALQLSRALDIRVGWLLEAEGEMDNAPVDAETAVERVLHGVIRESLPKVMDLLTSQKPAEHQLGQPNEGHEAKRPGPAGKRRDRR